MKRLALSFLFAAGLSVRATDFTEALDLPGVVWSSGSTGQGWRTGAEGGVDFAEVTNLAAGAEAWLEATLTGPALVEFQTEALTPQGFWLEVKVDSEAQIELPMNPAMTARVPLPAGNHLVRLTLHSYDSWIGAPVAGRWVRVNHAALLAPSPAFVAEALDTPGRVWFAAGWARDWEGLTTGHDGVDSLFVDSDEYATLQTEVTGPALVSFWQKYSSTEEGDASMNIEAAERPLGFVWGGWQQQQTWIPPGAHWISWKIEGDGGHLHLDEFAVVPSPPVSLAEALDTVGMAGLGAWTTSPENPWTGAATTAAPDGVDFAAGVAQPAGEGAPLEAWLETAAQGPGRLRWTGTGPNPLPLLLNGTEIVRTNGHPTEASVFLAPGPQTLRWVSMVEGGYAALDRVVYEAFGSTTPAAALDSALTFTTGGSVIPAGVTTAVEARDGTDYLLFPALPAGGDSWVETSVTGPGTMEFFLSASNLRISLNGVALASAGGAAWNAMRLELPAGLCTVRWSFAGNYNASAMLDGVTWTPGARALCDALDFHDWALLSRDYAVTGGTLTPSGPAPLLLMMGSGDGIIHVQGSGNGWAALAPYNVDMDIWHLRAAPFDATTAARIFTGAGTHVLALSTTGAVDRVTFSSSFVSLAEAVDAPGLNFTTGGDGEWRGAVLPEALYAGDSAASPQLLPGQSAWMETSVTGPGIVRFFSRLSRFDSNSVALVISMDGLPAREIPGYQLYETTQHGLAIPAGLHTVRWEYRRRATWPDYMPYLLLDGITFTGGADITSALDAPERGWLIIGAVTACVDSGEDVALLTGGTVSTHVEGPATVRFRWRSSASLTVGSPGHDHTFPLPGATAAWQEARYVLPPGPSDVLWSGTGSLDAVSIEPGAPDAEALELTGVDWRALYLAGAWDTVAETNRMGGSVLRSRLSAAGTNRLSVFMYSGAGQILADWRSSGAFTMSANASPAIAPAGPAWSTASLPLIYLNSEVTWTHTSASAAPTEARLDLVTVRPQDYFRWANEWGIGHLPQEADTDGDGVPGIVEFATGTDPGNPASASLPEVSWSSYPGGGLPPSWQLPAGASSSAGLRWSVRYSTDLQSWAESQVTPYNGTIQGNYSHPLRAYYQLAVRYEP